MSESSRRKFLAGAGAGVAAGAVVGMGGAAAAASRRTHRAGKDPVVAYVRNPQAGVVAVMIGEREVVVTDHDLVARILDAAGGL